MGGFSSASTGNTTLQSIINDQTQSAKALKIFPVKIFRKFEFSQFLEFKMP